jgi:hypothetical protein
MNIDESMKQDDNQEIDENFKPRFISKKMRKSPNK